MNKGCAVVSLMKSRALLCFLSSDPRVAHSGRSVREQKTAILSDDMAWSRSDRGPCRRPRAVDRFQFVQHPIDSPVTAKNPGEPVVTALRPANPIQRSWAGLRKGGAADSSLRHFRIVSIPVDCASSVSAMCTGRSGWSLGSAPLPAPQVWGKRRLR